jgi:hypothetical protein
MKNYFPRCTGVVMALLAVGYAPLQSIFFTANAQSLYGKAFNESTDTDQAHGDRQAGGGLDEACGDVDTQLTAMRPLYRGDRFTQTETPTLVFYVPYRSQEIVSAEFLLLPIDESDYVEEFSLRLPETPGIVAFTFPLPSGEKYPLTDEYRWYFNVICESSGGDRIEASVNGWIQYADSNEDDTVYYDLIAMSIRELSQAPDDSSLRQQWSALLVTIDDLSISDFPNDTLHNPTFVNATITEPVVIPEN